MSIELRIPDIGDFEAVEVVEVLIRAGDAVAVDQSVLVLESDKAAMEVPADKGGTVESISIAVGDKVKQGDLIATLCDRGTPGAEAAEKKTAPDSASTEREQAIVVPDIGDFDAVEVIEVAVAVGDTVGENDALITLESDKATMEVPAEQGGEIIELTVKVGDKVSTGTVIGKIALGDGDRDGAVADEKSAEKPSRDSSVERTENTVPAAKAPSQPAAAQTAIDQKAFDKAYASPSVRRFARELGADLAKVTGTGRKGRILAEDVKAFVKQSMTAAAGSASGIPLIPAVDFSAFGAVEEAKLSRINVLTSEAMTRCWLNIPHVTQHDLCDITELEAFRKSLQKEAEKRGVKVTMVAFLMKALATGLQEFPRFNASLSRDGKHLIMKKYTHIGIAVDTPNGLVVPVIREVDRKGIYELSEDLMAISAKAREGKLGPRDMSGASMTISSLGGIGGRYFTPIVNAPEVAILGVSRASMQPLWDGEAFVPKLMLPLSLSYDHRVIDGALAARMTVYLGGVLSDMRRSLL